MSATQTFNTRNCVLMCGQTLTQGNVLCVRHASKDGIVQKNDEKNGHTNGYLGTHAGIPEFIKARSKTCWYRYTSMCTKRNGFSFP